jgi:hypothetical protein
MHFPAELHFRAAVLGDDDLVPFLDGELNLLALVVMLASADGNDEGFLRLFFGGVGDDDPAFFDFRFLDRLHENPITEGANFNAHGGLLLWLVGFWVSGLRSPPEASAVAVPAGGQGKVF